MRCPYCGSPEDKVVDSRTIKEESEIRRRRECLSCSRRFTTYERIEEAAPIVIKKDGEREPFDRNKIRKGLLISCQKRNVSVEQIEQIILQVEKALFGGDRREIPTHQIGQMIMDILKGVDAVAYVRFASVYKEFKDIDAFIEQVKSLGTASK